MAGEGGPVVLYARDIVEKDFVSMSGDTDAFEAAKTMKVRRRGFVVVVTRSRASI